MYTQGDFTHWDLGLPRFCPVCRNHALPRVISSSGCVTTRPAHADEYSFYHFIFHRQGIGYPENLSGNLKLIQGLTVSSQKSGLNSKNNTSTGAAPCVVTLEKHFQGVAFSVSRSLSSV